MAIQGRTRTDVVIGGMAPAPPMIVAATYLLRAVVDSGTWREIRLFEGFASFKPAGIEK